MTDEKRQRDNIMAGLDVVKSGPLKSPLSRWLRRNYRDLVKRIGDGQVSWQEFAALLASEGMTDQKGNSPSAETVRQAWLRTKRTMERLQEKKPARSPKQPQVAHVRMIDPKQADDPEPDYQPASDAGFRPATAGAFAVHSSNPSPVKPPPGPATPAPRRNPDETLGRFFGASKPPVTPFPTPEQPEEE